MFLSKTKYNEMVNSVNDAKSSVAKLESQLRASDKARREAIEENARLKATIAEYESHECEQSDSCCESDCEVSKSDLKKEHLVNWINDYIADDLKFISNNKLRAFVANQIATELGTPVPTEFTTDIADENLERINHIMYAAVTLDSYLGAEGLTIRKK